MQLSTKERRCVAVSQTRTVAETYLIDDWSYKLNAGIDPEEAGVKCTDVVSWHCKTCNGIWKAKIYSRWSNKSKCPYCTNQKVLTGFNDLGTRFPKIAKQLDEKRTGLSASQIPFGSALRATWKCEICEGSWQTKVYSRTGEDLDCPYCTNQRVLAGFNDLKTKFPKIAKEFDEERNNISSSSVIATTCKRYYWKCNICKGSWKAQVARRTVFDTGCPYCTNQKVLTGFNDLQTKFPDVAKELAQSDVSPSKIIFSSASYYLWRCSVCSHEWKARVCRRTTDGKTGCPICAQRVIESSVATYLKDYCLQNYPSTVLEHKGLRNPETGYFLFYDIYIPCFKLYIEVHGQQHYIPVNEFCRTEEMFLYRRKIDQLKKEFAQRNGHYLEIDIREIPRHQLEKSSDIFEDFIKKVRG